MILWCANNNNNSIIHSLYKWALDTVLYSKKIYLTHT